MDQGDLIRWVQKTERARFRRHIIRAQARLWRKLSLQTQGNRRVLANDVAHEVYAAFEEMQVNITPKKPKVSVSAE